MKPATPVLMLGTLLALMAVAAQQAPTPATSLHVAVLVGDLGAVEQHIESGADLNERDAFGSTPLLIAATFDRPEAARALLEAGADPDLANADGGTALHTAAFLAREEIVELLLDAGANRYLRDDFGNTPLGSVSRPFDEVREFYDAMAAGLAPLGLELDYERIRQARPGIAELLRPTAEELAAVEYAPAERDDWPVSTPEAEGLDPLLVAELYRNAVELETLYGVLIVKDGQLIAEGYFNEGAPDTKVMLQSVTKSYTSALVGIALEQGCLESVDEPMLAFFPEYAEQIEDPRKAEITVRELLQMRGGYPWEETDPEYWAALVYGDLLAPLVDFPLTREPGSGFQYSNTTSHWLGVIVARACGTDLRSFAQEHLFGPLDAEVGFWRQDRNGDYVGMAELRFTARDAAKFGQLYLDDGVYRGERLVPAAWVAESLQTYTEGAWERVGWFDDIGYGYQWWSATAGEHRVDYAWGHGGQLIVLLDELDLIVVTTAVPFYQQHDAEAWRHERSILTMVSEFIEALPSE